MENNNYQIWTVKLASNHDGYQEVGFRKPDCYTNHTVIEVDMTKFIIVIKIVVSKWFRPLIYGRK